MKMDLYEKVRTVPATALKTIGAGRLKGKSDINPMWRIKTLTEQFGMCGIGWKYVITKQWLEQAETKEQAAFVNIDLFVKVGGEWSEAIPGTGGSSFVANESKGLYVSDECFKMALTDAISVACKALGFGADIYWNADNTKYSQEPEPDGKKPDPTEDTLWVTKQQFQDLMLLDNSNDLSNGVNTLKEQGAVFNKAQWAALTTKKKNLIAGGN